MNISYLRTFLAISSSGTFNDAAERLNITQAAVSARIKALEEQVGQSLFSRGRGGAVLTAAGRELLPHAESITRTWVHAISMLGVPVSRKVPIRIGAQFSTWAQLLLDWAAWIAESLPETELDLNFDYNTDMLKAVNEGSLDLAITHDATSLQGMHTLPLQDEIVVLVARRPASLNEDRVPNFIRLDWGPQFGGQIKRIENRLPKSHLSIGNGMLGLRYILEHDACAYIPWRIARRLVQEKRLFRIKRAPRISIPGHIVYSEDNPNLQYLERALVGFRGLQAGFERGFSGNEVPSR